MNHYKGGKPRLRRRPAGDAAQRRRAHRDGRDRAREALPWLYGTHAVIAALANPARRPRRLVATESAAAALSASPIAPEILERAEIDALLPPGAVHQGLALMCEPLPERSVEDIAAPAAASDRIMVVALDQVSDPQNVGAVLRSAAAFGAAAVIVPDRHAPETTGALAKAASGAVETVPLIRATNLVRALETLKEAGFWVVGLDMAAEETIDAADLPSRCVLALGAEGAGLRRLTRETCDLTVRIPISPAMESLNVSASAAVALYEWARRAG